MIRELLKKDYSSIVDLENTIHVNFKTSDIAETEKVFVFEIDKKICGFIQILSLYETLEIVNIAVSEEYKRQGIGTKLIDFVINKFNPEHILLEVSMSNENAINFYKKNNFIAIRTIKHYNDLGDALAMERKLQ